MNVGLIDVDNWGKHENCFPNLPLMKISSFYKRHDHSVEWYEEGKDYDLVFKSKVFSFTPDIPVIGDVVEARSGGSGYFIHLKNGKEVFDKECHRNLIDQIEHSYPDYGLYGITDTAFGFMSRGCPRGCHFCHVEAKEGRRSYKVADLSEFWSGQKKIELMDPNTFACKDWKDILTNFNTTFEQDLKRCLFVRDVCGFQPYVMRYDKEHIPRGANVNALARWMNWKQFCWTVPTFEDYKRLRKEGKL